MAPTSIDGSDITSATIDGQDVSEITVDGQTVFTAIPDSGVFRLTFDDAHTSGSTAEDIWNGNDGTINGATTGVSGANQTYTTNEAYSFDEVDDVVNLGSGSQISAFEGPKSVAAWFKTSSSGSDKCVWGFRRDNPSYSQFIIVNDSVEGVLNSADETLTSVTSSTGFEDGNWHHVVFVMVPSDSLYLYIDGSLEDSVSNPVSTYSETTETGIGLRLGQYDDLPFGGGIDDPRQYAEELTSTQVSNLYNTGSISG